MTIAKMINSFQMKNKCKCYLEVREKNRVVLKVIKIVGGKKIVDEKPFQFSFEEYLFKGELEQMLALIEMEFEEYGKNKD